MGDVTFAFLTAASLVVLGALLKRVGVLSEDHGRGMSAAVLYVTLPALILKNVSQVPIEADLLLLAGICIVYSGIVLSVALLLFRKSPAEERGLLGISCIGYNIGLFAYPIVARVWGAGGMQYLAAFDIGSAITNFGLAFVVAGLLSPLPEARKSITAGRVLSLPLRSVPLLSYAVAFAVAAAGWTLPGWLDRFLGVAADANQVLIFLSIGVFLKVRLPKALIGRIGTTLVLRYGGGLALGAILYMVLPFEPLYRGVLLVALILPASVALVPISVRFGYKEEIASAVVNITILLSFPLMWILMARLPV
jgi:malate permease and related proteins